jgi:protein TonB
MFSKPLTITILVSAMFHMGAVIVVWQDKTELAISTSTQGSPLNIAIRQVSLDQTQVRQNNSENDLVEEIASQTTSQETREPVPQTQKKSRQVLNQVETGEPRPVNEPESAVKPALAHKLAKAVTSDAAQRKQAHQDHVQKLAVLNNHMVDYLATEFRIHFKYPMLARKRGWQGQVVLGLDIDRYGQIARIAIQRSSGYKVLDHNAVRTFELIGEISPTLKRQLLQDHHLSIPVVYQLTGS